MKRITIEPYDSFDISTFVVHNGHVHFGHFGGIYNDSGVLLETVKGQTLQCFHNLEAALKKINLTLDDLIKVTVILKDIADFQAMHRAWQEVFPSNHPVRTTITSAFVDDECLVQIEGVAGTDD